MSSVAMAANDTPGCNSKVMDAMNAKAQAKVAYDVAATEQIIKKPDSVLALTCFNNAAGIAAAEGGKIFSGDFSSSLAPVISDALSGFYGNFKGSVGESKAGVTYDTALGTNANCNNIQKLWDNISQTGIETGAPNVTFAQLVNNKIPATAGDEFKNNWTAEAKTLTDLKTAVDNVPKPENTFTSYTPGETSCQYMQKLGITTSCF